MSAALTVGACGLVTAVGLDAPSSCAALRARLDGFRETLFTGPGGEPLIGAAVPMPRAWTGAERLSRLLAATLVELIDAAPDAARAALVVCLPEADRAGTPVRDPGALVRRAVELTRLDPIGAPRLVAHGRPSGVVALDLARRALAEVPAVIVAAVDSYLTAGSVGHYNRAGRLLGPGISDGFIPGEAAAAVLCTRGGAGLRLAGIGLTREPAPIWNGADEDGLDRPLRGDGMTAAYRAALAEAGMTLGQVGYRIADYPGEQYFFKQSALAMGRLLRDYRHFQDVWSPAEGLGNIGAAAVPVMLSQALVAARKGYAGGGIVLIESSGDDGACGSAILEAA